MATRAKKQPPTNREIWDAIGKSGSDDHIELRFQGSQVKYEVADVQINETTCNVTLVIRKKKGEL